MARETFRVRSNVSRRTLAYGSGGADDRSVSNAIQAVANRAQAMARQRKNTLTDTQRERIRRAGMNMVNLLIGW